MRGAALESHGNSYLNRVQHVAEMESELKLQRFMRDMPKFERQKEINSELEEKSTKRQVEDILFENGSLPASTFEEL